MGLDSVEILMKVEDTFGIKIPDGEAEQIYTIGDFHNAVWRHLSGKSSAKCKSQILFYKLRKLLNEEFNFSPHQIKLETSPDDIFPQEFRREKYLKFSDTIGLTLPELKLTRPWSTLLSIFGFVTITGGLVTSLILINFFNISKWTLLITVAGALLTFIFSNLLNSKRTAINEQTFREFIQHTLALNYSTLLVNEGTNRQEMETVMNHIIADMAGLDLKEVSSEKRIADDLGID